MLNLVFFGLQILGDPSAAFYAGLQCLSSLAVPLCYLTGREKRPSSAAKYSFYLFYPLHILLLLILRMLILRG